MRERKEKEGGVEEIYKVGDMKGQENGSKVWRKCFWSRGKFNIKGKQERK